MLAEICVVHFVFPLTLPVLNVRLKNRVLIIERDALLRKSYEHIINGSSRHVVVGTVESLEEAFVAIRIVKPELLLVDAAQLKAGELRSLKTTHPYLQIMVWTSVNNAEMVFDFFRAGASGYLLKDGNYHALVSALDELSNGGAPLSSEISRMVVSSFHVNSNSPLTNRETEILNLLAKGKTHKEISSTLAIAKETSRKHVANIYQKLKVKSKAGAIAVASSERFIIPSTKPHQRATS
ncbi:MAG TPA: response regulator transcription factor [Chryseosolibacter sp.]